MTTLNVLEHEEYITTVSAEWGTSAGNNYIANLWFLTNKRNLLGPYGSNTGMYQGSFGGPGWKLDHLSGTGLSTNIEFLKFHFKRV